MVDVPRLYPLASNRILFPDGSTVEIDTSRLQLCFHTMSGYLFGSEAQWKHNGQNGIRSHFGLGGPKDAPQDDGHLVQWNSLQHVAYAQNGGNPYCISVETSDGAVDGLPWSDKQVYKIVDLIIWFTKMCGRRSPQMASAPGEFGTITYHQQFSTFNPNGHDCPGPVRLKQLAASMRRAAAIMNPVPGGNTVDAGDVTQIETAVWTHDVKPGTDTQAAWSALRDAAVNATAANTKIDALQTKVDQILTLLTPVEPTP